MILELIQPNAWPKPIQPIVTHFLIQPESKDSTPTPTDSLNKLGWLKIQPKIRKPNTIISTLEYSNDFE